MEKTNHISYACENIWLMLLLFNAFGKFELMLLAKYEEEFSSYTLRCFMEQYMAAPSSVSNEDERLSILRMQSQFSITSVKVLLVSLLNGKLQRSCNFSNHSTYYSRDSLFAAFRDLTLMGVQAFDFNHLNNVLVSLCASLTLMVMRKAQLTIQL